MKRVFLFLFACLMSLQAVAQTAITNAGISNAVVFKYPFTLAPIASFTMSGGTGPLAGGIYGVAPFTATLTDTSINNPTSWIWQSNGVQFSTSQNPSFTVNDQWRIQITETAINAAGQSSASAMIFSATPYDECLIWSNIPQTTIPTQAQMSNSFIGTNLFKIVTNINFLAGNDIFQGTWNTNVPGQTNGNIMVASNGSVYSQLTQTNQLIMDFNTKEQSTWEFASGIAVTNVTFLFHSGLPLTNSAFVFIDFLTVSDASGNLTTGNFTINRWIGESGVNGTGKTYFHTLETTLVAAGHSAHYTSTNYLTPNKDYRYILDVNTNGVGTLGIMDPLTTNIVSLGISTNYNARGVGNNFTAFSFGHVSGENQYVGVTNELMGNLMIQINRAHTMDAITNLLLYGP